MYDAKHTGCASEYRAMAASTSWLDLREGVSGGGGGGVEFAVTNEERQWVCSRGGCHAVTRERKHNLRRWISTAKRDTSLDSEMFQGQKYRPTGGGLSRLPPLWLVFLYSIARRVTHYIGVSFVEEGPVCLES